MKYCPNRACPHRARVQAPAEFEDRVAACSDCQTPLVGSEQEAIAGLEPMKGSPYRGAPSAALVKAPVPAPNDAMVGWSFFLGSLALMAGTFVLGGNGFVIAFVPMAYGFYRLTRVGEATRAATRAPARLPRSTRPAARLPDPGSASPPGSAAAPPG